MKKLNLLHIFIAYWSVALVGQFVFGIEIDPATARKILGVTVISVMGMALLLIAFYETLLPSSPMIDKA